MSFTSVIFLIVFLPLCVIGGYLCKNEYRNTFLLIASMLFYAWCGLKFLILLLVAATVAYVVGLLIGEASLNKYKKIFLIAGIVYSVGNLVFYKYLFGILETIFRLPIFTENDIIFNISSPILPLGISFYTFSILSYMLDVYMEKCEAQKNIFNVWLYIMFFPRIVQGPIMRYGDFEPQLNDRKMSAETLDSGLQRFIIGMFKKVLIADRLADLVAYSFGSIGTVGTIPAWLGIIGYLIQLYYDFSGYSDMAIGLGRMFGFTLPENFNYPYMSETVSEYWRRWHISLGEWFRDYLYMPLSRWAMYNKLIVKLPDRLFWSDLFSLFVTWVVTGIWHGSGLQFVAYGVWYFLFIAAERIRDNRRKILRKKNGLPKQPKRKSEVIINHIVTIFALIIGQVLFRSANLNTALRYIKRLFILDTRDGWKFLLQLTNGTMAALILGMIFIFPVGPKLTAMFEKNEALQLIYRIILIILFLIAFCYVVGTGFSPFLYEVF